MNSTLTSSSTQPDDSSSLKGWTGRQALITGGAGFLGGTLARQLLHLGARVRVLDLAHGDIQGVEYHRASITDPAAVARAVAGCHTVFHLAARVRDYGSDRDFYAPNVLATEILLSACHEAGTQRFVFMSSLAATDYRLGAGAPASGLQEAEAISGQAMGAYGRSKRIGEWRVAQANKHALTTTIVRPGMFPYGPGDRTSFAPLASAMQQRIPLRIGNGQAIINTAYAPELARGLALCGILPQAGGEIFHLADPDPISWDSLYRSLARGLVVDEPPIQWPPRLMLAMGKPIERAFGRLAPSAMPPLTEYRAFVSTSPMFISTAKARQVLGFRASISLPDGLAATIRWYREHYA